MSQVLDRIYLLNEKIKHLQDDVFTFRRERNKLLEEKAALERQRIALKLALRRISESTVAWKDEEANMLIEKIGMVANEAINRDEQGFYA